MTDRASQVSREVARLNCELVREGWPEAHEDEARCMEQARKCMDGFDEILSRHGMTREDLAAEL